ncbi:hypothetical protein KKP90_00040 [Methanothermococcus sp. SCGC AD-155-E23]|nr:hypothetical protein [Methanothermococcus sp. SCGC AD-155-E23]
MKLIHVLGKKYVEEILTTLNKYGPLHASAVSEISGCPYTTLTRRLEELEKIGLIKTCDKPFPLKICEITDLGRKALKVYRICDEISKQRKARSSPEVQEGNALI